VTHTLFMKGDYQRALDTSPGDIGYVDALSLLSMGRREDALRLLRTRNESPHPMIECFRASLHGLIEGRRAQAVELTRRAILLEFRDPEALYYLARQLAHLGEPQQSLAELKRVVEQGFCCVPAFVRDPWLDALRDEPGFVAVLRQSEARHQEASSPSRKRGASGCWACRPVPSIRGPPRAGLEPGQPATTGHRGAAPSSPRTVAVGRWRKCFRFYALSVVRRLLPEEA
jgi:hypothetical protein